MIGAPWNPERLMALSTPFSQFMSRELGDDDIFSYKNLRTGNFGLAVWVKRGAEWYDLLALGKSWAGTREDVKKVKAMVRGSAEGEENRRHNREVLKKVGVQSHLEELQEDADQEMEVNRWLYNKLRTSKKDKMTQFVAVPERRKY